MFRNSYGFAFTDVTFTLSRNSTIIVKLPDYVELSKDINGNKTWTNSTLWFWAYFTMKNKLSIKHEILYEISETTIKKLT